MLTNEEIEKRLDKVLKEAVNSDGSARLKKLDELIELTDKKIALQAA